MKATGRATVLVLGLALSAVAAAAVKPEAAHWRKHQLNFTFSGFTTHYSCGGFEDTLSLLLRAAGARGDAKVVASCMAPMNGPEPFSSARLTFHTLVPAEADATGQGAAPTVAGVWKPVELRADSPRGLADGDCELVDQFARRILPLFTTRDVKNRMNCVPHEVNLGGVDLKFTVLAEAPSAAPTKAPR